MTAEYATVTQLPQYHLWDRTKGKRIPYSFDLELTARCNNSCRHCYINLPRNDRDAIKRELTAEDIASITDQAVSLGSLWCLITGGEPLLRDDFSEIYTLLKRKGLLVGLFTNACLISEEHISLFKRYPPRDIEVTVYGATKETYEKVTRRPGSYAAFRRGLDLLLERGVKVRLKAMALRSTVHELPEISRFCRTYTKDYFRFDPLLHLRYDGNKKRNAEIMAERLLPEEVVAIEQADQERADSLLRGCDELIIPALKNQESNRLFTCGAGVKSFTIGHDGYFRLCSSLWHPGCVYDLRKGSLKDAWEHFVPQVLGLRSSDRDFLEKCRKCPIINLCLWCPAHAYLEAGRMDAWCQYFCEVAHARAKALEKRAGLSQ
ncbi:MAG: pyrroloquinoline quinone biosynthesis protein PqqE [Euryarchaeota archaeon ADurb.BinA087]|nr:MAG: pyrroloquinoline quinone biosynthesis protein PqqE [Euryarchaeota archaeon ADurb.BinA087]